MFLFACLFFAVQFLWTSHCFGFVSFFDVFVCSFLFDLSLGFVSWICSLACLMVCFLCLGSCFSSWCFCLMVVSFYFREVLFFLFL